MAKRQDFTSGYDATDKEDMPEIKFSTAFGEAAKLEGVTAVISSMDWLQRVPNALVIDVDLTEDEWLDLIRGVQTIHRRYQWYLGDALVYGVERRYGETGKQMERISEITGKDENTLAEYYRTARLFEIMERSTNLEFEQHRVIARAFTGDTPEDRQQRLYWLAIAERDNLSGRKLKAAIQEAQLPATVAENAQAEGMATTYPALSDDNQQPEAVSLPAPVKDKIHRRLMNDIWKKVETDAPLDDEDRGKIWLMRSWCDALIEDIDRRAKYEKRSRGKG